ncbi:hypothetical protein DNL40_06835 [Xylanimonas oleitrophica]|uniref:Uncharacterized protein n=1 Tax=Xylanimonas oleitrophica TaxID=2607479 RepID=A0A2W5WTA8_9MICO|nr:hypothetical protein [Xylanimonas oleitrophica]PZR53823.1 hypothetical protein DNL40_06835 [Xylanimonas oleitrophica]
MRATVLLADAAEAVNGKVYGIGFGWNITTTPTPPQSVVVLLDVGWDETNRDITVHVELLDQDGHPVAVPGPAGARSLSFDAKVQVGRPAGVAPGTSFKTPLALNIGPGIPLEAGRYEWRVTIDGEHHEDWSEFFTVQAAQHQPGTPGPSTLPPA